MTRGKCVDSELAGELTVKLWKESAEDEVSPRAGTCTVIASNEFKCV